MAALGADVLRVSCDKLPEYPATMPDLQTGKRDTSLDLKTEAGKEAFSELVRDADVLIDGYRPGALQRLGFGSASLRELNPSLIYLRENCYGFKGPLAGRSPLVMPGSPRLRANGISRNQARPSFVGGYN